MLWNQRESVVSESEWIKGRIAILGIGREGQAARRYLRAIDPDLRLTLISEAPPEPGFAERLKECDRLYTGPLSDAGLENFDVLVRSPGVSPYRKSLGNARAAGVRITTPSNLWFAAHPEQKTICITGTKGKSTTSALLAHLIGCCGQCVRLAGNIGLPLLDCDDRGVDWWVIELSSFQLADLEARPTLSVILNLTAEHLDWHGSERVYRNDKLRLAELTAGNPLIANAADPLLTDALAQRGNTRWFNSPTGFRAEGNRLYDGDRELPAAFPEGFVGTHNLSNAAAALTVLREIGADLKSALKGMPSYRCLPHRLQVLGRKGGLRYVNDSISSTPVATAAALETFAGEPVTLIVGGLDRGLDWSRYEGTVRTRLPRAIIGIPDNGSKILAGLKKAGIGPINGLHETPNLEAAVALARDITPRGGVILLSPGAPSFPHFRDYRDRGRQFAALCGFEPWEKEPAEYGQ